MNHFGEWKYMVPLSRQDHARKYCDGCNDGNEERWRRKAHDDENIKQLPLPTQWSAAHQSTLQGYFGYTLVTQVLSS
jgi:hypothetical protein